MDKLIAAEERGEAILRDVIDRVDSRRKRLPELYHEVLFEDKSLSVVTSALSEIYFLENLYQELGQGIADCLQDAGYVPQTPKH